MKRYLLTISYKGTNYCGFQKQKNGNTIQEELENTLKQILKEDIVCYGSGRTDARVHALNQYVHFDTNVNIDTSGLVRALNTLLPLDIRIKNAQIVKNDFHTRFDAKSKTYLYIYSLEDVVNPFYSDMVTKLNYKIDFKILSDAINKIKGKHNFKAFCASGSSSTSYEKTIFDFGYEIKGNYLIFKIKGDGFLYNMVRIIIGTIIDISRNQLDLHVIDNMFKTGDRTIGGQTAKPEGLYLFDVEY